VEENHNLCLKEKRGSTSSEGATIMNATENVTSNVNVIAMPTNSAEYKALQDIMDRADYAGDSPRWETYRNVLLNRGREATFPQGTKALELIKIIEAAGGKGMTFTEIQKAYFLMTYPDVVWIRERDRGNFVTMVCWIVYTYTNKVGRRYVRNDVPHFDHPLALNTLVCAMPSRSACALIGHARKTCGSLKAAKAGLLLTMKVLERLNVSMRYENFGHTEFVSFVHEHTESFMEVMDDEKLNNLKSAFKFIKMTNLV
jgi:hypothetical protein